MIHDRVFNMDLIDNSNNGALHTTNVIAALSKIKAEDINFLACKIKEVNSSGGFVFVAGNGGSAALANHFATDISVGALSLGKQIRAISLVSNTSNITATANDFGYANVFSREIEVLVTDKDLVILISSSGNSKNLLNAAEAAKKIGANTFGLVGFDGGKLLSIVDFNLHVYTKNGEYGVVEDCHSVILHAITNELRQ